MTRRSFTQERHKAELQATVARAMRLIRRLWRQRDEARADAARSEIGISWAMELGGRAVLERDRYKRERGEVRTALAEAKRMLEHAQTERWRVADLLTEQTRSAYDRTRKANKKFGARFEEVKELRAACKQHKKHIDALWVERAELRSRLRAEPSETT